LRNSILYEGIKQNRLNVNAPYTVEDKVELNEHAAHRQHPAHENARNSLCITGLRRNVARNLVRLGRVGDRWFPESEEGTDEGQGNRYADPEIGCLII
jgi:hypothetical protein